MDNLIPPLYSLVDNPQCENVICIDNGFTPEEISSILSLMDDVDMSAGIVGEPPTSEEERLELAEAFKFIRKSDVHFLNVYAKKYKWIYDKLVVYVNHINHVNYKRTLYGIEPLQYTEYDSSYSGFYGVHKDDEYSTMRPFKRVISFSVQLTDASEYEGGELIIYDGTKQMVGNKQVGSITFFDSLMQHEVSPVTKGFRKSLVGWVNGPRV